MPQTTRTLPKVYLDQADEAISTRVQSLLQTQERVLIAIDGNCCAGKTTTAATLGTLLQATVFHLDDYFLQPHMRTPERLGQPGGNVDAERFLAEVLLTRFSLRKQLCQVESSSSKASIACIRCLPPPMISRCFAASTLHCKKSASSLETEKRCFRCFSTDGFRWKTPIFPPSRLKKTAILSSNLHSVNRYRAKNSARWRCFAYNTVLISSSLRRSSSSGTSARCKRRSRPSCPCRRLGCAGKRARNC